QRVPPIPRLTPEHADDVVDTAVDAAGKIIGAKARSNGVLDDEPRYRIGERSFEAVADLDAHLALARRHNQQDAVVLVLLTDLPVAAELHAEIFDRGTLQ